MLLDLCKLTGGFLSLADFYFLMTLDCDDSISGYVFNLTSSGLSVMLEQFLLVFGLFNKLLDAFSAIFSPPRRGASFSAQMFN